MCHVYGIATIIFLNQDNQVRYERKEQEILFFISKKKNEGRCLIFWLLKTLIDLRIWETGLIA
jgi:hypothetical protein